MEKTLQQTNLLKAYIGLTKPGIIFGNLLTAIAGYALAAYGHWNISQFIFMLEGLAFVIAASCVCNNFIDRNHDSKMRRTRLRALACGTISNRSALYFAAILLVVGTGVLYVGTNTLTTTIALIGVVFYVIAYSLSKHVTSYATLIGSISGSIPPVVGYTAYTHSIDTGFWLLFFVIVMWQMPHFFAIAIYRMEDYANANIPIFPIVRGILTTKKHMIAYVMGFIVMCGCFSFYQYSTWVFFAVMGSVGMGWMWIAVRGLFVDNNQQWARKMFIYSLVVIMAFSITLPFTAIA